MRPRSAAGSRRGARRCAGRWSAPSASSTNQGFVSNAPAEVVEAEREKLTAYRARARGARRLTTSFDAEGYLVSLEPLGWHFGLERIRRLVSVLGMPQHRFASIHVVGTNGKSSVAEMAGALLEAHGKRTGVYLSPHTERWSERVRIGGAEIDAGEFAAAAERVAQSIEVVNRTLADGESVTQFEAVTATAFVALASAQVELGVIEAGLGGRLDATNVLPSGRRR